MPAELITPADVVPIVELGVLNCGVFPILKASARNSSSCDSFHSGNFLNSEKSTSLVPGPSRILRPALPYRYKPGVVNAAVLNQWRTVRWSGGRFPLAM